jgi:hypothetical protein
MIDLDFNSEVVDIDDVTYHWQCAVDTGKLKELAEDNQENTGLPFWYTIMYNKDAGQCVARMIALEHRSPPK